PALHVHPKNRHNHVAIREHFSAARNRYPLKQNFCAAAASSGFLDRFLLIPFHKDTFINIIGIPECRTLTV
ncbi:MAG: hypothetical protein ACLU6O_17360, partial [Bilophila wadsworthia]